MRTELPRHLILVREIVQILPILEHKRVHQLRTGMSWPDGYLTLTISGPTVGSQHIIKLLSGQKKVGWNATLNVATLHECRKEDNFMCET